MKSFRILLLIICVAVLLAFNFPVSAIEFNAEEKYNSVFVVTSGNSLGSGFAIGVNCVITNAHVVKNPNSIQLTTYSGKNHTASLVGYDENKDIAVLSVDNVKFTPLKVANYKKMNTGDDVYAIGAPKSMAYTLTKGVISAKERKIGDYTYIQTDAAINEGNSGGPLINEEGSVIGVNTLKMMDSEGIGLAIPMTSVSEFVKSLDINIDDNGNVTGTVTPKKGGGNNNSSESTEGEIIIPEDKKDSSSKKENNLFVKVLLGALLISTSLNIFLIIVLVFQKRKNITVSYDPSERTDFEIDILE